jgi:hypothetical protein
MADDPSTAGSWTHTRTCVVMALAFAGLSWAVAAASYSTSIEPQNQPGYETLSMAATNRGRRALGVRLAIDAVMQLPNAHCVVTYAIWDRPWLLGVFGGLEVVPLGLWFLLRRVERDFEKPRRRAHK